MSAAEKIIESTIAHRPSLDNLSIRAKSVLLRGLQVVLNNSKSEEEFEEAQVLTALLADDAAETLAMSKRLERFEQHGFHDNDDGAPIAGLPAPGVCPFCKEDDHWIPIVTVPGEPGSDTDETKIQTTYHAECTNCGCEGPGGMTKLEAAELWNKGSRVDYSVVQTLDAINLELEQLSDVLRIAVDSLRMQNIVEDAPATSCIDAAIDARLLPAREKLRELLLVKLAAPANNREGLKP